ncbi:MAG: His-Xaa-Ser system protein HxsD [Verrucomicrobiota bacterium]
MVVHIEFPVEFTSADALQRALYRVAEEGSWNISKDETTWKVTLTGKIDSDISELEATFKQHVVDYGLREKIRSETDQVRALLLAHAFSAVTAQS